MELHNLSNVEEQNVEMSVNGDVINEDDDPKDRPSPLQETQADLMGVKKTIETQEGNDNPVLPPI